MTLVDVVNITAVTPKFFVVTVLFLLFILSMLSLGVLRLFQKRALQGVLFFLAGVIGIVAFVIVLANGYVTV